MGFGGSYLSTRQSYGRMSWGRRYRTRGDQEDHFVIASEIPLSAHAQSGCRLHSPLCVMSTSQVAHSAVGHPLTPFVSYTPFNAVAIDLYQPGSITKAGFRYVLTVVDLCTRWCMFFPIKTKFPAEVIAVFLQRWCHLRCMACHNSYSPTVVKNFKGWQVQCVTF